MFSGSVATLARILLVVIAISAAATYPIGGRAQASVPQRARVITTVGDLLQGAILLGPDSGYSRRTAFTLPDSGELGTGGIEVVVKVTVLRRLEEPHYIRASINGRPIYMMKLQSITESYLPVRWFTTDLVQGGVSGIELTPTFEGASSNFGARDDLQHGQNAVEFSLVPDGSPSLRVAIEPETRILSTPDATPGGSLKGHATVRGNSISASGTLVHSGLSVQTPSVRLLAALEDGRVQTAAVPIAGPITDGARREWKISLQSDSTVRAIYVQYDTNASTGAPVQVWPVRRVSWWVRIRPPALRWWSMAGAFVVLWIALPNLYRARGSSATGSGVPSVPGRLVGMTAGLTVVLLLVIGGALWAARWHRLPNGEGAPAAVALRTLPVLSTTEAGGASASYGRALESLGNDATAWSAERPVPLTEQGVLIGYAVAATTSEAGIEPPGVWWVRPRQPPNSSIELAAPTTPTRRIYVGVDSATGEVRVLVPGLSGR